MKLHRLSEITINNSGLLCRQGRFMGVVNAIVLGGAFAAAPVVWYMIGAPSIVWGICLLVALIVVPLVISDAIARFRNCNWLLWIRPDGLWINFRSYQDRADQDTLSVVQLNYDEIAEAYSRIETYSTPTHRGHARHRLQSLNLVLKVGDTRVLQTAIAEDRRRKPPMRTIIPGVRGATRPTVFAVSLPLENEIKINWRGGTSHWTAPKLSKALELLRQYVPIGEPQREDARDWRQLSDEEFDAQVLTLVEQGARIEAIKLLTQRRGYTVGEAHRFVDELQCRC